MRNSRGLSNLLTGLFVSILTLWTGPVFAGGLSVPSNKFVKVFTEKNMFHSLGEDTDENDKPITIYRAHTRRNSVSLYLKGKNIHKAVMMFFSYKKGDITDLNLKYINKFLSVFTPGWTEGGRWTRDNLLSLHKQRKSKSKTSQGGVSVVLDYDSSFGMVKLSVR
ncbi:MAG: hypothetical protein ACE5GM_08715 [bacterium]